MPLEVRAPSPVRSHPRVTGRNLARDPFAARLNATALKLVDARIANLEKGIRLLGSSNPEWNTEQRRVDDDIHERWIDLSKEGLNLVSLGLAKWAELATAKHLQNVKVDVLLRSLRDPLASLPADEAGLQRVLRSSIDPEMKSAILTHIAALHRLEQAQQNKDIALVVRRVRDMGDALAKEFDMMKGYPPGDSRVADALYSSSALIGNLALVFYEGSLAPVALVGSISSSVVVSGRILVSIREDYRRSAALAKDASLRESERHALLAKLDDLKQEQTRLAWATERSR